MKHKACNYEECSCLKPMPVFTCLQTHIKWQQPEVLIYRNRDFHPFVPKLQLKPSTSFSALPFHEDMQWHRNILCFANSVINQSHNNFKDSLWNRNTFASFFPASHCTMIAITYLQRNSHQAAIQAFVTSVRWMTQHFTVTFYLFWNLNARNYTDKIVSNYTDKIVRCKGNRLN